MMTGSQGGQGGADAAVDLTHKHASYHISFFPWYPVMRLAKGSKFCTLCRILRGELVIRASLPPVQST